MKARVLTNDEVFAAVCRFEIEDIVEIDLESSCIYDLENLSLKTLKKDFKGDDYIFLELKED